MLFSEAIRTRGDVAARRYASKLIGKQLRAYKRKEHTTFQSLARRDIPRLVVCMVVTSGENLAEQHPGSKD